MPIDTQWARYNKQGKLALEYNSIKAPMGGDNSAGWFTNNAHIKEQFNFHNYFLHLKGKLLEMHIQQIQVQK